MSATNVISIQSRFHFPAGRSGCQPTFRNKSPPSLSLPLSLARVRAISPRLSHLPTTRATVTKRSSEAARRRRLLTLTTCRNGQRLWPTRHEIHRLNTSIEIYFLLARDLYPWKDRAIRKFELDAKRIGEYIDEISTSRETSAVNRLDVFKRKEYERSMRRIEKTGSRIFRIHARKISKEIVKTTMKFRSRFVRGNRIRIVSPRAGVETENFLAFSL